MAFFTFLRDIKFVAQISRPMAAVCNVENAAHSTRLLASTTLRFSLVLLKLLAQSLNLKWIWCVQFIFSHISINETWMICAISLPKGLCLGWRLCKRFFQTEKALLRWLWQDILCLFLIMSRSCQYISLLPQVILSQLDAATDPWGIKVERVEVIYHYIYDMIYLYDEFTFYWTEKYICPHSYSRQSFNLLFHTRRFLPVLCFSFKVKDVRLPQNLQRAMAAEAEASREARAKVKLSLL